MGRKKKDNGVEPDANGMVPRDLDDKGVADRKAQLADTYIELADLEDEKTEQNKELSQRIKELKKEARRLATEIRTEREMVPAQLALGDAMHARRSAKRGSSQDVGAPVKAPLAAVEP